MSAALACVSQPLRTPAQVFGLFEALVAANPGLRRPPEALDAIERLLDGLGHPERRLRIVHIAGSKGKGSTALLTEAIFGAAGLRVGTYTSPHLQRWTERFRVGGREIDAVAFVAAAERVRPHLDALLRAPRPCPPTFFDVATAIAFTLFERAGVDVAVIEAGIGGRLDATNVVTPCVSCITSVELEHTDKLGDTLQAIAREKSGIIKPGVPAVVGALPPPALDAVRERAAAVAAPLRQLGRDFSVRINAATDAGLSLRLDDDGLRVDATLPVLGPHQAANAALAAACVQQSGLVSATALAEAVTRGLAGAALPGRTEILARRPWVVADGAHTEVSAAALMLALDGLARRERHMVVSLSAGKDLARLLSILLPGAASVTMTRADPLRSADPALVAASARACCPQLPLRIIADPHQAIADTLAALPPDALMCVTGSVYIAGAARTALAG